MTSKVQDAIRDEIADIRFSRRKLALPADSKLFRHPADSWDAELKYHDECIARVKRLFANRRKAASNRYGYFA